MVDGAAPPRDPFAPDAPPLSAEIPMMMGNTPVETTGLIGGRDPTTFSLTWEALLAKLSKHARAFTGDFAPDEIVATHRRLYPDYTPSGTPAFRPDRLRAAGHVMVRGIHLGSSGAAGGNE